MKRRPLSWTPANNTEWRSSEKHLLKYVKEDGKPAYWQLADGEGKIIGTQYDLPLGIESPVPISWAISLLA